MRGGDYPWPTAIQSTVTGIPDCAGADVDDTGLAYTRPLNHPADASGDHATDAELDPRTPRIVSTTLLRVVSPVLMSELPVIAEELLAMTMDDASAFTSFFARMMTLAIWSASIWRESGEEMPSSCVSKWIAVKPAEVAADVAIESNWIIVRSAT